jgi:hypothetical protein
MTHHYCWQEKKVREGSKEGAEREFIRIVIMRMFPTTSKRQEACTRFERHIASYARIQEILAYAKSRR